MSNLIPWVLLNYLHCVKLIGIQIDGYGFNKFLVFFFYSADKLYCLVDGSMTRRTPFGPKINQLDFFRLMFQRCAAIVKHIIYIAIIFELSSGSQFFFEVDFHIILNELFQKLLQLFVWNWTRYFTINMTLTIGFSDLF